MEVYVEYALIDNLIMDYLLLKGSCLVTKTKLNHFLVWCGAILGTIIALIIPIFDLSNSVSFLIKIVLAMLICLISANHKTIFNYLKFLNCFVLLTFIVGGVIIGILSFLNIDYSSGISGGILPVGLNILIAYIAFKVVLGIVKSFLNKKLGSFKCKISVCYKGERQIMNAFIDSGNFLVDVKSGLPVIVCKKEVLNNFLGEDKPERYMPITTASGIGMMALYPTDYVTIVTDKKELFSDAMLGVCDERLNILEDCIISPNLL